MDRWQTSMKVGQTLKQARYIAIWRIRVAVARALPKWIRRHMITDILTIPARNVVQTMAEWARTPLVVKVDDVEITKERSIVLRVVDTYNHKRRVTETVAQVAEWTGTRWDGYYLTESRVVDELVAAGAVRQADDGNFHLTDFMLKELEGGSDGTKRRSAKSA